MADVVYRPPPHSYSHPSLPLLSPSVTPIQPMSTTPASAYSSATSFRWMSLSRSSNPQRDENERQHRVQEANRNNTEIYWAIRFVIFQPMAIENLGLLNPSATDCINDIGSRISSITGDRRESSFLFESLSINIWSLLRVLVGLLYLQALTTRPDLPHT